MKGTVVVGVDGTPAGLEALGAAADEAIMRSSTLLIAHASEASPPDTGPAAVTEAVARARDRSEVLRIRTCVEGEPAGAYLSRLSGSAELVVVGRSESSGLTGLLAGSVSTYVATHARCPVLVVPADTALTQAPENPGTIIVGVDPDHSAEASVGFAVEEAALRQVDVRIVIAASGLSDARHSRAAQVVDEWESSRPAIVLHAEQVGLPPDEALIAASEEAGLLVIGTRAHDGRLGHVGRAMLRYAFCPVAIVRTPDGAAH
jgi:nucleotide-binding universal stress UspA family protein